MSAPASSSGARAPSATVASSSSAEAARAGSGEATSSSSATAVPAPAASTGRRNGHRDRTLEDVMREPSSTLPDVLVLESMPEGLDRKEVLDPKEDLWLSTADG